MEEINEIISAVTAKDAHELCREVMSITDTIQIDAAHKAAVHETQFPKDLENAYELGRELVRQAQEE